MNALTKVVFTVFMLSTNTIQAKGMLGEIVGATIGSSVGKAVGKSLAESESFESELVKMSDRLNKKMPMAIDKDTRIDNIIPGPGLHLTYNYTIVTAVSQDINDSTRKNFLQNIQPRMTTYVCSNPDTKLFLKNGVIVSYYYRVSDGGFVATFDITPKDCGFDT